jgi:hypothetical protein
MSIIGDYRQVGVSGTLANRKLALPHGLCTIPTLLQEVRKRLFMNRVRECLKKYCFTRIIDNLGKSRLSPMQYLVVITGNLRCDHPGGKAEPSSWR